MSSRRGVEEVLRLLFEVSGEKDVEGLADALRDLGDVGESTEGQADELVNGLERLVGAARKADAFGQLSDQLAETDDKLRQARDGYSALTREFDASDRSSAALNKRFRDAQREISSLTAAQIRQRTELERLGGELKEAGVDAERLGDEQERLRREIDRTTTEIQDQASAARRAAADQQVLQARLADGDEAFRRQATASRASREALDKYRAATKKAEGAQDRLAASSERTVGLFGRLRGALVGLTAFFGVREAVEGAKNILGLGDAAERARDQLAALYGSRETGGEAFAKLRDIARANGQEFNNVLAAAQRLKAFGLEPLDGTIQSLIDQNSRLGGTQETLEGLVLAVGQAWAKQKLQGEEILQLVERGVPVWDLLSKATGKNVTELQALSAQGKLGRDVIKQLLDEIGRSSEGAAQEGLSRLSGLVAQLRDRVQQFFTDVANSGALDFFKQRITALLAEIQRLQSTGDLAGYAKRISDAIVASAQAIEGAIRLAIRYSGALIELGKAYLAIQVATFIAGMTRSAAAMLAAGTQAAATAKQVGGLRGALLAIPANVKIAIAAVGLQVLISGVVDLRAKLQELREAERERESAQQRAARLQSELNAAVDSAIRSLSEYRNVQLRTADEVAQYNDAELKSYQDRLSLAARYYAALEQQARDLGNDEQAAAARAQVEKYRTEIERVIQRLDELKAAKDAGFATPEDQGLRSAFQALGVNAQAAGDQITEQGGRIIEAFAQIADHANTNARQVGAAFSKALDSVSTTAEVRQLEVALTRAFDQGKLTADQYSVGARAAAERTKEIELAANEAAGGFVKVQNASKEATDAIIRGWQSARSDLAGEAQKIANDLAHAIAEGASESGESVEVLRKRYADVDAQIQELNKKINQATRSQVELTEQTSNFAAAARSAADDVEGLGGALEKVDEKAKSVSISLGKTSKAFQEANRSIEGLIGPVAGSIAGYESYNKVSAELRQELKRQREDVDRLSESLEQQLAQYDPLTAQLTKLQQTYKFVDEARLREIAQQQQRLEELREQARKAKDEAEDVTRDLSAPPRPNSSGSGGGGTAAGGGAINITINGFVGSLDRGALQQLARDLRPYLRRLDDHSA